ncbi:testis-specific H1 histone [Heterocephalus glaber]|uniref:Testis-specific H1 histone n=1 Tax=Heterocephalus glaber TaxID=10181 RepID=A0AAX6PZB3_HETGA|nr:testis-specific H1 histone [Heterocephalus glaber]
MAAAARPSAESQGADMSAQRPAGRALGGLLRGIQSSVLRVSQVVLRAITAHKGLTLTALRKELAKAGYEVRRQVSSHSGGAPRPEGRGVFLRVSSSNSVECFRVWRTPKPRRKPGRPRLEEGGSSSRRSPPRLRKRRRRLTRRQAASNAREEWRRNAWLKARPPARARGRRPKAPRRASKGDSRPEPRGQKRSSSKLRQEKKQEPKKQAQWAIQRPTADKADRPCSGPREGTHQDLH